MSLVLFGVATLQAVLLDAQGDVYIVSSPTSGATLTTPQPFQPNFQPNVCGSVNFKGSPLPLYCRHGLISKYSPDGKQPLAATYLGGNGDEFIADIQLDPAGNIVLVGHTTSSDFPTTPNAYRSKPASGFLTVLTADCSHLIYSTYLDFDAPSRLLIDSSGRPILIGQTQPPGFAATAPVTSNNDSAQRDFYVARMNRSMAGLEYAIEIGGTMDDVVQAVALDKTDSVYIAGYTSSTPANIPYSTSNPYTSFPVTPNSLRQTAGVANIFVVKLDLNGQIVYSTVFGSTRLDSVEAMTVDQTGSVYLTGAPGAADFPVTSGAANRVFGSRFALKLSPDASQLVYSTFLTVNGMISAVTVDDSGILRIAGVHRLSSTTFRSTQDAAHPCAPVGAAIDSDYYIELSATGATIQHATLIPATRSNGAVPAGIIGITKTGQIYVGVDGAAFALIDAAAKPSPGVTCVANAASYRSGAIAPGEIVTLFGSQIGPEQAATNQAVNGIYSADLAGVRITFNGFPAPLLYVSQSQINAIVPFEIGGQTTAELQVAYGGQKFSGLQMPVAASAPGIFTLSGTGDGYGAIVNEDGTINSDQKPAPKGSIVSMYVTGGGAMQPTPLDGAMGEGKSAVALSTAISLRAYLAAIFYSGDAPTEVQGLIQINFQIPANLSYSGYVPIDFVFGVPYTTSINQQATVWVNVK